jgi:GNAT superfamily N-acetyltransferase
VPVINCVCGHRIDSAHDAALFTAYRSHSDEAHRDLGITDDSIRKLVAATARMTQWDGTSKPADGTIEVRALTSELSGDFLTFFDRDAFMDNPDWSGCYCLFYQYRGDDWETATAEQNRAAKEELIARGEAHGYLAYLDGAPVGWCHAAPRATLPGLDRVPEFRCDDDPARIGAIVCFNVAAPYRGQGLAKRLLDAACEGLRAQGFATAEAYPAKIDRSAARDYHGRLNMYLDAGFVLHRDAEQFVIVRKAL